MENSSGGHGEADSINSFGDHRSRSLSEEEPGNHASGNITQHTTPAPETHEENKDLNSSSDTANFFHNSQPDLEDENHAHLSFDNDSVMGAPAQPLIHLNANPEQPLESGEQSAVIDYESSYSGYTASNHDELLTSQTRSTRTQDQLAPMGLQSITMNARNWLSHPILPDSSISTNPIPRILAPESGTHTEQVSVDRSRPQFEEQIEDTMDEIIYLLNNERVSQKEQKSTLVEQQKSFTEYYKVQKDKLLFEQELWTQNLKKAKESYVRPDEVFEINIGGTTKIAVSKKTLCKAPESMLAAMFSGRHKLREHKGKVFIDRDSEAFCMMISYLRNNKIPAFLSKAHENLFYEELEYWQIPIDLEKNELNQIGEFDPDWCANTLKLENNTLVRKHGPQHGVVFCKYPFDTNRTYIEFRITMNIHVRGRSSLFVGVVDRTKYRPELLTSTFWKDSPSSFYWDVWNGKLIKVDENGSQTGLALDYGCKCQDPNTDTVIGISYDYKEKTLSYYKNGSCQGIAFHNVPWGLYPSIDLWFESGHVEILKNIKKNEKEYL